MTSLPIILAAQFSGVYLRYLPFSREISADEKILLAKRFFLWSAADLAITFFLLTDGLTYRAFKIAMLTGWLPYVLISMTVIRNKVPQHFFVFGMQGLWCFMLHSAAGGVVALLRGQMAEEFIPLQLTIYLVLFVALFKVEQKFFVSLLPSSKLFENRSLRWCISLLPVMIFIGTMLPIVDVTFLNTWRERLSRIILPIVFFLMYRSLSLATRRVEERQAREQKNFVLRRQTESLAEQNALMQSSRREVEEMERNLADNYDAIEKFLVGGKVREAMDFIGRQTKLLDSTAVKFFCRAPLINAALSMYSRRAAEFGIKTSFKVDLPEKFSTDESDLAVLLSNLLENAITASKINLITESEATSKTNWSVETETVNKTNLITESETAGKTNPPSEREIFLTLRNNGGQYVLEITNRFDLPIEVGENGLPCTKKIGHGLGMASLEIFANKHDAFVDFSHEGGLVRFTVYWNDYL